MSEISLYNALRKIPELSDDEAKEAVADVASSKDVVTKADLANLEVRLTDKMTVQTRWLYGFIVLNSMFVIAVIKYL